jgi:hypothetical protein
MDQADNPYVASEGGASNMPGADCLLVDGNVNFGKDKGQGQLLFTRTSVFAFRAKNQAAMAGGAMGGLVGALIGHFIDKKRAQKQPPPDHMADFEIRGLDESTRKKIERASLLVKLPLGNALNIERTRLGFKFSEGSEPSVVYQGLFHKDKITAFLATLGIDAR